METYESVKSNPVQPEQKEKKKETDENKVQQREPSIRVLLTDSSWQSCYHQSVTIEQKGKEQIIIDEIPYEVNKANMVRRMDEIRIDKKIDGIVEVRDETDKDGLQITIELKKDVNPELILAYLFN